MQVKSTVKLNMAKIHKLTQASVTALERTAEALHTEVVQAQVMPFETGHLQEDATFVDYSESSQGKVSLVTSTPYARRLYYHPEYNFQTDENPFAGGNGTSRGCRAVSARILPKRHSGNFTKRQVGSDAGIKRYPGMGGWIRYI